MSAEAIHVLEEKRDEATGRAQELRDDNRVLLDDAARVQRDIRDAEAEASSYAQAIEDLQRAEASRTEASVVQEAPPSPKPKKAAPYKPPTGGRGQGGRVGDTDYG